MVVYEILSDPQRKRASVVAGRDLVLAILAQILHVLGVTVAALRHYLICNGEPAVIRGDVAVPARSIVFV